MQKSVNTFIGGMNQDLSLSKDRSNVIYEGTNIRIITDKGLSSGSIENMKGNVLQFRLSSDFEDATIVGATTIRDRIVLFVADESGTETKSYIMVLDYDFSDVPDTIELGESFIKYSDVDKEFKLNFSINHPIRAKGWYESENIQKIYWSDYRFPLRFCNVEDPTLQDREVGLFDIVPSFSPDSPRVTKIEPGGSLVAGQIQYFYQQYNLNGAETELSTLSPLVHLTRSAEDLQLNAEYVGSPAGENTLKSCTVTIDDLDSRFDKIRLYSIHFTSLEADPTISVIYDGSVGSSDSISIIDSGNTPLAVISTAELNSLIGNVFSPRDIEVKDNILFASNIKTLFFNDPQLDTWDARAYRFDSSRVSRVDNDIVSGTDFIDIDGTAPDWQSIPENHNAKNFYNNTAEDGTYDYKYQTDGTTVGGSGPNVSYSFTTRVVEGYQNTDTESLKARFDLFVNKNTSAPLNINNKEYPNPSFDSFHSPYWSGLLRGYQRDEVYRFGIVFLNSKGKHSFVKWIGDIRFPNMGDEIIDATRQNTTCDFTSDSGSIFCKLRTLGISFSVNNVPDDPDTELPYQWKIVRVKREEDDKTILAQGIMDGFNSTTSGNSVYRDTCPSVFEYYENKTRGAQSGTGAGNASWTRRLAGMLTPEVFMNPNFNVKNGTYYSLEGVVSIMRAKMDAWKETGQVFAGQNDYPRYTDDPLNASVMYSKVVRIVPIDTGRGNNKVSIIDSEVLIPDEINTVGTESVLQRVDPQGSQNSKESPHGTSIVSQVEEDGYDKAIENTNAIDFTIGLSGLDYTPNLMVINLKRDNFEGQYGGNTFSARANNSYIECCQLSRKLTDQTVEIWGGDTFVCFFDYLRNQWSNTVSFSQQNAVHTMMFPVETSINLNLRSDVSTHRFTDKGTTFDNDDDFALLTEEAGYKRFIEDSTGFIKNDFTQGYNLYEYNTAYSRESDVKLYIPKPLNYQDIDSYDVRTLYSDQKINNETTDSWTNFKVANFNEADSTFGPIRSLHLLNNNLVFFQDKAVGTWAVNQRSLVNDGTPTGLAVGDGGVLDRYDYITTSSGCRHTFCPIVVGNTIYYFDAYDKKIKQLSGQDVSISDIAGMNSFFQEHTSDRYMLIDQDNPLKSDGSVVFGYDEEHNEVRMTFLDAGNPFNIIYNRNLNKFTSFCSGLPKINIQAAGQLFTSEDLNSLYVENRGNYNFFNGVFNPSSLVFTVNKEPYNMKVFTNQEFMTEVEEGDGAKLPNELALSSYEMYNNYQAIPQTDFTSGANIKQRERLWRMQVPRATVDRDNVPLGRVDARFRSNFLFTKLNFNSGNNHRYILHDIITTYITPNRGYY